MVLSVVHDCELYVNIALWEVEIYYGKCDHMNLAYHEVAGS